MSCVCMEILRGCEMADLFGDMITAPRGTVKKSDGNAADGFAEFWKAWPSNARKVAKQQCLDKWARNGLAEQKDHIIAHVEWMKTQEDWVRDQGRFICAPLVYINQQRWADWEPPKARPARPTALDEIKEHKGAPMPDDVRERLARIRRGH